MNFGNGVRAFLAIGLIALCCTAADAAQFVQTPFGRAWVGVGPNPDKPVTIAATPAAPEVFRPTFEADVKVVSQWGSYPVNEQYFATSETAQTLCKRLMCLYIKQKAFAGSGGPFSCTALERWLVFAATSNGASATFEENAGILGAFYLRNPEDQFPGLADKLVNAILDQDRAYAKPLASLHEKTFREKAHRHRA